MGGFGSGRRSSKETVGQMRALDVRKMKREGCLQPGYSGQWTWSRGGEVLASIRFLVEQDAVRLMYKSRDRGGEWQEMDYRARLDWTPRTYGGARAWFLCPSCGRRVARIVVTLINVLMQNKAKYDVASICNGGGGASAVIIELEK